MDHLAQAERIELRESPPPGRTPAQLRRHFEVEKGIADRLRRSDRAERARIYATMYDELFSLVPDHPRLTRRRDPVRLGQINAQKLALLKQFLAPDKSIVEFGCGDASFAHELCGRVAKVYGVDISDQRDPALPLPANFEMVVYNGFDLPLPDNCADVAFSDQLIEHLHPDDAKLHFETVRRTLRPGGVYVLRTPHRFSGPHDVSRYISLEPQGFHLKEWTYRELHDALSRAGYSRVRPVHSSALKMAAQRNVVMETIEFMMQPLPQAWRCALARRTLTEIAVAAFRAE